MAYVQRQPFSSHQEKEAPLDEHRLEKNTEQRLQEIIAQLARVAGGHYDTNIDVTSSGEMGHLERILQETIVNLKFSHDALAEQVEHLDDLVQERTKNLTDEIAFRKTVEENLEHALVKAEVATHTKNEFLATMSHEIRTPLTAILGYTEGLYLLGDIGKAPPRRIEMLSAIKRNGSHLLDLISDLLDLSQIEAGQLDLIETPSSPHALVLEVAANLLGRANAKGLELRVECPTPIPRQISIDPKRLRQVLTNLIVNAIKFTNDGYVVVRLTTQESASETAFLEIAVEDSGIGIPKEKQAQIFEPFTHGHDQSVCEKIGTGLGLSICRRLVTASGGEIRLTSNEGTGSVITFTVPFTNNSPMWQPKADDLVVRQAAKIEWEVPETDLSKVKILIVEDTPDTQDLLTLFLEEAGADVTACSNGADGVSKAVQAIYANSAFDLILMDMRMPGIDGYAATRRLRSEGVECPIVALTAFAMKHDEQACLDAGCDAYLSKPIDLCAMFKTIEQQLPQVKQHALSESESGDRLKTLISDKIADSQFQPLLQRYLQRLPGMLDQIQTARDDGDLDSLLSVVHRLRGTAESYGFPQISVVADKCEKALRIDPTKVPPGSTSAKQSAIWYSGSKFRSLATGFDQRTSATTTIGQSISESLELLTSLVDRAIESNHNDE